MELQAFVNAVYNNDQARVLVALVLGNLALGIVAALLKGQFSLERLPDFLLKKLFPLMIGWAVAVMLSWAMPDYAFVKEAAWGALILAGVGNILRNLGELGIKLPKVA